MMISILEASTGLLDDDQYTGGFRHWVYWRLQTLDYWMMISILEASDTGLLDDDQYTGGFRHWITG